MSLDDVDQSLGLVGTGVALSVPGLPSTGFKWPVEVDYADPAPASTVLGYSTDGTGLRRRARARLAGARRAARSSARISTKTGRRTS